MRSSLLLIAAISGTVKSSYLPCNLDLGGLIGSILPTTVESSPNPIGTTYPGSVTGTINGTLTVVPIPYAEARAVIPSQYGILKSAYEAALPGFPADHYPLIIRAILDHDVGLGGLQLIPDFQSIHIFYPFVDLLGDGYSAFAYNEYLLVTATNLVAQAGIAGYGETPVPSIFMPPNNAYAFTPEALKCGSGEIFLNAYSNLTNCSTATTRFKPQSKIGPWPYEFYKNVTNQPIFKDPTKNCDQQITFYNSTLSTGKNAAVGIKGDIFVAAPYLPKDSYFKDVSGIKVDIAFIENNMLPCESLKGQ